MPHSHSDNSPLYSTWWIVLLGSLTALGPLAIDLYLPALPNLANSFGTNTEVASYSVTIYFIGMVIGQLLYGPLSDRFGRKPPLYYGLALYVVASALCALAISLEVLIIARLFMAIGGTAGVVIARASIRDKLPTIAMAQAFSTLIMVMGLAPILAPTLGDIILHFTDWHSIFWILSIIGIINLGCVHWFYEDTLPTDKRKHITFWQTFSEYKKILSDKTFTLPASAGGCMLGSLFVFVSMSAGLMMEHFGLSSSQYSWVFGINSIGFVAMSQVNIKLIRKYPLDGLFLAGASVFFVSIAVLMLCIIFGLASFFITWLLIFIAIATIGITGPNGTTMALEHQAHRSGIASSMLGGLRFFMGVLGTGFLYLLNTSLITKLTITMLLLAMLGVALMQWHRSLTKNGTHTG